MWPLQIREVVDQMWPGRGDQADEAEHGPECYELPTEPGELQGTAVEAPSVLELLNP